MNNRIDWKYCPVCASRDLAHDHAKAIRCRTCGFLYYQNMAAAVAAIIEIDGKILAGVRAHDPAAGMYDLPGGFVDHGETAEEALAREIREELNLEVTEMRFLCTAANDYLFKGVLYPVLDIDFVCRIRSFDAIAPADDVADYVLLDPANIDFDRFAFRSSKAALARYLAQR